MKIYIIFCLLFFCKTVFPQKIQSVDLITVQGFVGGPHTSGFGREKNPCYTVIGLVTNDQDTTISFLIMNKSWYIDNWVIDNDSIFVDFSGWSLNTTQEIKLLPHQSTSFSFELTTWKGMPVNKTFRLGLIFTQKKYTSSETPAKERVNYSKVYWSNSLTLEDDLLFHKLL